MPQLVLIIAMSFLISNCTPLRQVTSPVSKDDLVELQQAIDASVDVKIKLINMWGQWKSKNDPAISDILSETNRLQLIEPLYARNSVADDKPLNETEKFIQSELRLAESKRAYARALIRLIDSTDETAATVIGRNLAGLLSQATGVGAVKGGFEALSKRLRGAKSKVEVVESLTREVAINTKVAHVLEHIRQHDVKLLKLIYLERFARYEIEVNRNSIPPSKSYDDYPVELQQIELAAAEMEEFGVPFQTAQELLEHERTLLDNLIAAAKGGGSTSILSGSSARANRIKTLITAAKASEQLKHVVKAVKMRRMTSNAK